MKRIKDYVGIKSLGSTETYVKANTALRKKQMQLDLFEDKIRGDVAKQGLKPKALKRPHLIACSKTSFKHGFSRCSNFFILHVFCS